jgi:simple sugar transport system substrate-binding protein
MRKILIAAAAAFLATGAGLLGASAADKLKVGFIGVGPIGDLGWTFQHDVGRQAMVKALGDKVDTTFVENVPEGADAERAIEQLARTGHKLIFTTSFGFMDATIKVAAKYPNVFFEHCTGFKRAANVSTYAARFYEGRYIQGQIAAKMSKSGVIGYIVSFPIPEVIMGIDAFMLGAQSVNPDFKVKIVWVNTWFDPGKEADAAKALFDQGADVLMQHTDSPAGMQIAEERKLHAFGQSSDMSKFGPTAHLASLIDNWGPYYIKRVQAVLDGTWKSSQTWAGFAENDIILGPLGNMPDDVKKAAEDQIEKIRSGQFFVFTGPIYKQDGTLAAKEGEKIDDGTLLGLNWYVKGIEEKFPQ